MPAFGSYKKRQEKPEINAIPQWQKVFQQVVSDDIAAAKKPVRWNFRKDNEGLFQLSQSLDPYAKLNEGLVLLWNKATGREDEPSATEVRKSFRKKLNEKDNVDGYADIAKGIETGKHDLLTSLGELLFMGTDAVGDTNFMKAFQDMMEKQKPDSPETWQGDLSSLLVQFGAPVGFITQILGRAKKLQKVKNAYEKMGTHKASKIAQRAFEGAVIVGAADFIASDTDRAMPGLYAEEESLKGLSGRKRAAAAFRNKVRYGTEGAIVGGLFPIVGKGIQLGYKHFTRPVAGAVARPALTVAGKGMSGAAKLLSNVRFSPIEESPALASQIANAVRGMTGFTLKKVMTPMFTGISPFKQLPPFKEWRMFSVTSPGKDQRKLKRLDNFLKYFRAHADAPKDIEGMGEAVTLFVKGRAKRLDGLMESMDKGAYKLAKQYEKRYNDGKTTLTYDKMIKDDVVDYLAGKQKISEIPKDIRPIAYELRKVLNELLNEFNKNLPKNVRGSAKENLKSMMVDKVNTYLVRSFATLTNPKYVPPEAIRVKARDWIKENVVIKNRDLRESAMNIKRGYGSLGTKKAYEKLSDDIVTSILDMTKTGNLKPSSTLREIGINKLRLDKMKFLKTGEELPKVIRQLLGEQKDLRSQVLFTASDAASTVAYQQTYDRIAQIGLKNGWLFRDATAAMPKYMNAKQITELRGLSGMRSELEGLFTSPEIAAHFAGHNNVLDKLVKSAIWRHMLQFKAGTQAFKTLYSPQTQVRNVTSASFFALWNGHIGGSANVIDSMRIVAKDIFRRGRGGFTKVKGKYDPKNNKFKPDELLDEVGFNQYAEKLVRLGVWDENVVASELREVLKDIRTGYIKGEDELFERLMKNLKTEKVAKVYAGGDNLWKQYGYEFYKSDLSSALKSVKDIEEYLAMHGQRFDKVDVITGVTKGLDDALDEAAAFMLRNTYPTYSKVPPAIQQLRKIPFFGNFVSFPSEMLRTGTTSIAMSLKNITSSNPRLRQMGIKQLMSAYLAGYGFGAGLTAVSYYLTGTTQEQWDAWKRSGAAPWDQNSQMYAITPFKNGEAAAINFSYFSPYDVLTRPLEAAISQAAKQDIAQEDIDDYVMSLMFAEDGPIMELLRPFIAPAIGGERVLDVVPGNFLIGGRTGRTGEGSRIYAESDSLEDKFNKSFAHILKGVNPGVIAQAQNLAGAARGEVTGAGKLRRLGDDLLALFTGTRIIRIDAKKDLNWLSAEFNRLNRAVDDTEKFYKTKNYLDRPPSVMVGEFNQMQEEAFRIQRKFYTQLKDMQMLDLDEKTLKKIMKKSGVNEKIIRNLLKGEFTPVNFSEPRFDRKIQDLEKVAEQQSNDKTGYYVNEDFVYPKKELKQVQKNWKKRKFFPETYNKETGQMEGGYKPEEAGYKRDAQGKLIRDDRGRIIKEPTFLDKAVPYIQEKISPFIGMMGQKSQTPLPPTPEVNPGAVASTPPINSQTGLTRTENALLSREEQAIRLRSKGMA